MDIENEETPPERPKREDECTAAGCYAIAKWRPIFLMFPKRGRYHGPGARFSANLQVCDAHKFERAEQYINASSWQNVLNWFDAMGAPRPARILTQVIHEPIVVDDGGNNETPPKG